MTVLSQPQLRRFGGLSAARSVDPATIGPTLRDLAPPRHHLRDILVTAIACGGFIAMAGTHPTTGILVAIHLVLWPTLMGLVVRRREPLVGTAAATCRSVVPVTAQTFLVLAASAWLADSTIPPASLLALPLATAFLTLASDRMPWAHSSGEQRRVLLAGHRDATERMAAELRRCKSKQVEVIGTCAATIDSVVQEALRTRADDVLLLPCAHLGPDEVRHLTWRLADQGRQLHLVTGLIGVTGVRTQLDAGIGITLVNLRHTELSSIRRTLLQALGRLVAAVALVVLAPFLLLLSLAIALESPGHPLFRQRRVGTDGHEFVMFKFRTMRADAEHPVATAADDPDGVLFKMRSDPRITRLGALLRRYSLDEVPQLINVVRGEMALVGPRPALRDEVRRYAPDVHRRLAARPGMTGLWQVSGRSDLSWEETVRLDLEYVDNWTPGLDAQILVRTIAAVILHRGAY